MKILACGVVYNEIDILPYLLDHFKSQGIEVFIFDNFSNDGTWEYLQKNNIPRERIFSDGKFSLVQFIKKMTLKWHEIQPDWCIYSDADEFPLTFQFSSLQELISDRDRRGFNVIKQTRVNFRPTGTEDFSKGDPRKIFRYYFIDWPDEKWNVQCERIFKYSEEIDIVSGAGHVVGLFDKKVSLETLNNPIFHYTMRQHAKEKILRTFFRYSIDEETIKLGWNAHYAKFIEKNKWLWDKKELHDIEDPGDDLYKILHPFSTVL